MMTNFVLSFPEGGLGGIWDFFVSVPENVPSYFYFSIA